MCRNVALIAAVAGNEKVGFGGYCGYSTDVTSLYGVTYPLAYSSVSVDIPFFFDNACSFTMVTDTAYLLS